MALMKLLRIPTQADLNSFSIESHTFFDLFSQNAILGSPFTASVETIYENGDEYFELGDLRFYDNGNDWFVLIK